MRRTKQPTCVAAVVTCRYKGMDGYAVSITPGQWVFRGDCFVDYSPYWEDFTRVKVVSAGVLFDVSTTAPAAS